MTPSEKGYFRKYQTGYSESGNALYLKLFDTLAAAKELNEKQIDRTVSGKAKNVHSIKNFLEKQILKSLRAYHHKKNISFELRELLDEIEILNDRSLQATSLKLIEKGIALAERNGLSTYQILFQIERRQLLKFHDEHIRKKTADEIIKKLIDAAQLILNIELIKDYHQQSIYWLNTFVPLRDQQIKAEAETVLNKLLDIHDASLRDFNELNFRDAAIANIYLLLNQIEKAIIYQKKTVDLLETIDLKKIKRQLGFASAVYNLCSLYIQQGNAEAIKVCLLKLEGIETDNPVEINFIQAIRMYIHLSILVRNTPVYKEKEIEEMEKFLLLPHPIPNLFYDSQFLLLTYYTKHANWSKAIDKSNYLLGQKNQHSQISIHLHARLLNILIHYKMGHTQLLPALIRHTYRYMLKQELHYELEKQILQFFKKVLSAPDKTKTRILLKDLRDKMKSVSNEEQEARVMTVYFDYKGWLEKELNEKS